jgi:toxin YoeB
MSYTLDFTEQARKDISVLKKSEPQAYKKLERLLLELQEHPTTGTGKPEQLKYNYAGKWSRHISDKHRLIYEIHEDVITVVVFSAFGHYKDK